MDLFFQLALVLAIGTFLALFMQFLRLPLVLSYLLTGMVAGPFALDFLKDHDVFEVLAKFGITALLFIVGLSLRPQVIREVGKTSLIVGLGQITFTTIIGTIIILVLGYGFIESFLLAIGLTFSSTIIVLKTLQDKGDLNRLYGRLAVGTMLVQDLAATVILVVLAAIGIKTGQSSVLETVAITVAKALLLGIALVFFARVILPRLTKTFAKSQEFLLLFAVTWGVGVAAIFKLMGFSIEIGALLAGMTLASSPYQYEMSSKMKTLRDFFLVLFFVALGASLSFNGIVIYAKQAALLSVFVLIGNPFILYVLLKRLGYGSLPSFQTGMTMAQVSEFSLVVILLAHSMKLVQDSAITIITLCAMITIALSSYLMIYDEQIYLAIRKLFRITAKETTDKVQHDYYEAILFGCHRLGEDFLPYTKKFKRSIVVDYDPTAIERMQRAGIAARYGDASDGEFIDELGIERSKLIITTVPDIDVVLFILAKVRKVNSQAIFIAMAHSPEEATTLYEKGASFVILPHYVGGNYASLLLQKHGLNSKKFAQEREKHQKHLLARIQKITHASRAL